MPTNGAFDDNDPVVASYTVYLTPPQIPTPSTDPDTKLLLLQYPAHRPAHRPYNNQTLQKPTSLRLKPQNGFLEVDIPLDTRNNYNQEKGSHYRHSLKQSRIVQDGGTHGLAGGFNTGPVGRQYREDVNLRDIPQHPNESEEREFETQTLGGKIVRPTVGDPIYMLGSFRGTELHLTHLDALVQVRPQLHHLDASDELERSLATTALGSGRGARGMANGDTGERAEPKVESKAVDIKIKGASDDNDINLNTNSKLLRSIQQEPWKRYSWVDEEAEASWRKFEQHLQMKFPVGMDGEADPEAVVQLHAAIRNQDWLDKMSAPRIEHGKKGLMGKVKGRERERLRRRRNDEAKRQQVAARAVGGFVADNDEADKTAEDDDDDDDDLGDTTSTSNSGDDDDDDDDQVARSGNGPTVEEETRPKDTDVAMPDADTTQAPSSSTPAPQQKKARGRPKIPPQTTTSLTIDDD